MELDNFLRSNGPAKQYELATNTNDAFFGSYPTLTDLRLNYTPNAPILFLLAQIADLYAFAGTPNLLSKTQQQQLAQIIATKYHHLKTSEIALFFFRLKAGECGHFYGSADPMQIMEALRTFMRYRNDEYARMEQERERRHREQQRQEYLQYQNELPQ